MISIQTFPLVRFVCCYDTGIIGLNDKGVPEHVWSSSKTCRRGKARSSTFGFIAALTELGFFLGIVFNLLHLFVNG